MHRMDLGSVGENAALAIHHNRVVLPRIPMTEDNLHELIGPVISQVMRQHTVLAEVGGFGIIERGDHVPRNAAAQHHVERGEDPGDMKRFEVRSRVGSPQTESAGRQTHRHQDRDQIHLDHPDPIAHGLRVVIAVAIGHRQTVVKECEVEFAGLQRARDSLVILGREKIGRGRRMAPRSGVVGTVLRLQKTDQSHLSRRLRHRLA